MTLTTSTPSYCHFATFWVRVVKVISCAFLNSSTATIFLSLAFVTQTATWAKDQDLNAAANKINQLNQKIKHIEAFVATADDKRNLLYKELAATEKQIGTSIKRLRLIQKNIRLKQMKIASLTRDVNNLNQKLQTQQKLLARNLTTRYKMGSYQPIKCLVNKEGPYTITRLFTFYQYLIQARQKMIKQIFISQEVLSYNQDTLKTELIAQQTWQTQLNLQQLQLEKDKAYHQYIIQSLNNSIQTNRHILLEYQQNKHNLSQLINSLTSTKQSIVPQRQLFKQMRGKLLFPLAARNHVCQKMNQGLVFFANEGTPVIAIHPGKIVFSDWLKGYGLLLIIDHGQGFMTLYAHNQSIFKSKGSYVTQGEQIACVGHSGGLKKDGLYFEIRQSGQAAKPENWFQGLACSALEY